MGRIYFGFVAERQDLVMKRIVDIITRLAQELFNPTRPDHPHAHTNRQAGHAGSRWS